MRYAEYLWIYNDGLIYQGECIINWDPQAKTALSNIEVIHKEIEGAMYYFKYKVVETGKELVIITTRPKPCLVIQAIFAHPSRMNVIRISSECTLLTLLMGKKTANHG